MSTSFGLRVVCPKGGTRVATLHPLIEEIEPYRNNWEILENYPHRNRRR
jgi:hypothetical protein